MSAAAVIAIRRRKFVQRFLELGATSAERAVPFASVGMRRSWIFDQMVTRGVFVHAGEDRYFMDEPVAHEFLARQRRRARVLGGILLLGLVLWLIAAKLWSV